MTPDRDVLEQGSERRGDRRRLRPGLAVVVPLAVLAVVAVVAAQRAGRTPAPAPPHVEGVSVQVAPREPVTEPVLVASYAVSAEGGAAWRLVAVQGPGAAPGARTDTGAAAAAGQPVGTQSVRVPVDCALPGLLDDSPGRYSLLLEPAAAVGGAARTRRVAAPAAPDLRAAVRRVCWDAQAVHLRVVGVVPDGRDGPGVLRLRVTVADIGPIRLALRVLDLADVDTVDPADAGVVEPGAQHVFSVRLRPGCPAPAGPEELGWAVGPPGGEPAGTARTALDAVQQVIVEEAARTACGPAPPLAVRVQRVTAVPAASGDQRTFRLQLSVRTAPGRAVLGQDPATLTADARPAFTSTPVALPSGAGTVLLTWRVSCRGPHRTGPSLPVRLQTSGTTWSLEVRLHDALLSRAVVEGCAAR